MIVWNLSLFIIWKKIMINFNLYSLKVKFLSFQINPNFEFRFELLIKVLNQYSLLFSSNAKILGVGIFTLEPMRVGMHETIIRARADWTVRVKTQKLVTSRGPEFFWNVEFVLKFVPNKIEDSDLILHGPVLCWIWICVEPTDFGLNGQERFHMLYCISQYYK